MDEQTPSLYNMMTGYYSMAVPKSLPGLSLSPEIARTSMLNLLKNKNIDLADLDTVKTNMEVIHSDNVNETIRTDHGIEHERQIMLSDSTILNERIYTGISGNKINKFHQFFYRSDDWNRQVLRHINPSLVDTIYLSWHEYLVIGENVEDPIPLTEEQVLAFPQFTHDDVLSNSGMHPDAIAILEKELGLNIRVWLTESAFREKKFNPEPWIFKWAQTLVNIQNYSLMLRNPYIDIIMIQSLMGWNTTSAINHGNQFPDYVPEYNGEDSCSPYGRTATAFSINFWNDISVGMTHMQELQFSNDDNEHLGEISDDPFDNYLSPDEGFTYSYLLGWKLFNIDQSIQRALITNIANENKTLLFGNDYVSGFTNNIRCIYITSRVENNTPSIDQYINGDGNLFYDTTYVDFSNTLGGYQELVIPAYSVVLFEETQPHITYTDPSDYYLHPVYPNPFNSVTTIKYDVSELNFVSINIYYYDCMGCLVMGVASKF